MMDLQMLTKEEVTTEFLRLNKRNLDACSDSQYIQALNFKKIRKDLLTVINELQRRREKKN